MSKEFREKLDNVVGEAIGADADLDEIEDALEEKVDRIQEVRLVRGES